MGSQRPIVGVVVACSRSDGRWLLIRRSAHVRAPLMVGFPGGEIEPGESERETAVREMREELGAEVEPLRRVWQHAFVRGGRSVTLHGWLAQLTSPALSPDPREVAEILWLTAEEAACHPDGAPQLPDFLRALQGHAHDEPE